MKTIGLIGGMSWLSTIDYYRIINQQVNRRLGGSHSAKIFLYSVDFEESKPPADAEGWRIATDFLSAIANKLQTAGAECLLLCANTTHLVADGVQQNLKIPLLHIAEATASVIKKQAVKKIGLLGTKFTMERDFFKSKLSRQQIETVIPNAEDRQFIHDSIFNELGKEIFKPETKNRYISIINNLVAQGAEGIILGCTEIPLLIKQEDSPVPVFDTTLIHATAAVDFALDVA